MRYVKLTCYAILLAVSIWFADFLYSDMEGMGLNESLLATFRTCVVSYKIIACFCICFIVSLFVVKLLRFLVGKKSGEQEIEK